MSHMKSLGPVALFTVCAGLAAADIITNIIDDQNRTCDDACKQSRMIVDASEFVVRDKNGEPLWVDINQPEVIPPVPQAPTPIQP